MTDTSLIQGQVIDSYALERKLAIIFFAKAITAFSTAVLYSSLNLYLISDLHFGEKYAAQLVGVFLGISYLLPLIGGYIGNRLIDFKALFCIGSSFQIMGDIALVIGGFHHLHLSLSIFLMGSLVNQVCNIMFIYEAVGQNELLIRRTMLWNYAIMNVGVLLGVSFSGFTAIHYKYNYLFILMALLTTVCVLLVHFCLDYKKPASLKIKNKTTVCIGILAACVLIVDLMLNYCNQISVYLIMIYLFVIAYLVLYVSLYQKNSRNNLIKLVFYIAIAMTYWVGYFLSPSLIMDLIKSHVDLQLAEFQIAPQWFENIDPLITILGTSTLAILLKQRQQKNKRHFSTAFLFSMGILFVVIALYIMGYIIQYTTNTEKISPYVIGLYFLILSIGGVFIAPESLNLANQLVPESLKGFATGIALGMLGISSIIASMIAGRILLDSQSIALSYYANTFHTLFIVMLIILALTMAAAVYFRKRI